MMMGAKGIVFSVIGGAILLFAFAMCTPKDGIMNSGGFQSLVDREKPSADRDTGADSLTTITAQTRETRQIVDAEKAERSALTNEIKAEYASLTEALQTAAKQANQQAVQTKRELTAEIRRLQTRLDQNEQDQKKADARRRRAPVVKTVPSPIRMLPVGDAPKIKRPPPEGYQWISPIDRATVQKIGQSQDAIKSGGLIPRPGAIGRAFSDNNTSSLLTGSNTGDRVATDGGGLPRLTPAQSTTRGGSPDAGLIPSYTIPENATLMGARAMTGLFGRVPVSGQIRDALPFRVITGAENLASQGFEIPDLERAIWSGVASGDRALRCVEGRLVSVTFIFTDGTIRTVRGTVSQPLGHLFDDHGYPCIPGTYITDAPTHIAGIAAAGAALGAASAISDKEVTRYAGRNGTTESVTGDTGKYIAGQAGQEAFSEIAGILRDRLKETFDAVVVQPGATVALAVSTEIRIDYNPTGRRIDYAAAHIGADPQAVVVPSSAQPAGNYTWRGPNTLVDQNDVPPAVLNVTQTTGQAKP